MTADEFIAIAGIDIPDKNSSTYHMAMSAASAITEFEIQNGITGQVYSSRSDGGRHYVEATTIDGLSYGIGIDLS